MLYGSRFTKEPETSGQSGIIYGSEASSADETGIALKNTAASDGAAVYRNDNGAIKQRNTTAGETVSLSTTSDEGWE